MGDRNGIGGIEPALGILCMVDIPIGIPYS